MPLFLTKQQLYRIMQQENPPDVYHDGSPDQYLNTADADSVAKVLESLYQNLGRIYDNYFPQYADEKISDWEMKIFGELGNASDTVDFRRGRILAKLRARKGIRKVDIEELVYTVLGIDKTIEIIERSSSQGSWILDTSQLDYSTILSGQSIISSTGQLLSGPDLWEKTAAELGLTEQELYDLKKEAYGYTIRIINYEATDDELSRIEALLSKYEPSRSWHNIENNATLEAAKFDWFLDFSELEGNTYL